MSQYQNIFDSHAHYDDKRFAGSLPEILRQVRENGVSRILNAACDLPSCESSIALTEQYSFFSCSVGIHPHSASECTDDYLDTLRHLSQHRGVVAIGEIGLDYHYDFSPRDVQLRVFEQQLVLAGELELPVIIHSREATQDTLRLLQKYRPTGVVHCFSGSAETAEKIINLGMYLGFTGTVTFKNAKKVWRAVEATPMERLLLETDCPYMAPVPFRGKTCTSDMISYTAEAIGTLKRMDPQKVIQTAHENTMQCFRLEHQQEKK